ncbi:MAG: S-methyl-5-thioribose-1-phosphate isomerase [Sutterellaceae bacterium]|nr:S-methyl-5-thioribose-1-phosphate isomerase [Sutterellaceae bacterium]MDD7441089.1 S-methyl-5-thioribose-1-phosphate isomerase [Sutterellaceae bacterium]MDY2868924.1 S-methyl-5-thioribose-1-phosphate isomerase [Mesosutterella sp.]
MLVNGRPYRTIWPEKGGRSVSFIDQTRLPFSFEVRTVSRWEDMARAVSSMQVRGAPLIGAAGAWAVALLCAEDPSPEAFAASCERIARARPTAVNLRWAVRRMAKVLSGLVGEERFAAAVREAGRISDEDVEANRRIGGFFLPVLRKMFDGLGRPVRILTHCNAGWLATVDYGTALSGIYQAHEAGLPLEVYADETRPRLQGLLTEWELRQAGVPCTVLADNSGGYLMQQGLIDIVIVGADRIAANGDTANKVGTYLKALAAHANGVPFYVAAPFSTIDFSLGEGVRGIPIERRSGDEICRVRGISRDGTVETVSILPDESRALNIAFDVTPAALVTGIVTERGIIRPEDLKNEGEKIGSGA